MTAEQILAVLKHLILHEHDLNLQKKLLSKFGSSYSKCIKEATKASLIRKLLRLQSPALSKNGNCDAMLILSNNCVQYLFKQRLKFLKRIVESGAPEFTWQISKLKTNDLEMKAFLMSEVQTYRTKQGKFTGIQLARNWTDSQKRRFHEYLRFKPTGYGKKSYVKVTKTRKHFEDMTQQYEKYVDQHNIISALITQ